MARPTLEVADIFRRFGEAYRTAVGSALSTAQRRVMTAIERCRTAALGGHLERCDACAHERPVYNSCRNRHCPKCQSLARARWVARREAELLDTPYFHVVFTLPDTVAALALRNKRVVYNLLFRATADTLRTIALDPRHLGAHIGFFAVLHTWGQQLVHHPHLHCVIPGGGLSPDGTRWIACRPNFFLPVRVLARRFRRVFLDMLQASFDAGELQCGGSLAHLRDRCAFGRYLAATRRTDWIVYAKPPFGGPRQVLDYVGRYTHRVAISNNRLVAIDGSDVTFRYRDYRAHGADKTLTLAADEFIRRFLLHVLPDGLQRIRYFGFLGNRDRQSSLAHCRTLLGMAPIAAGDVPSADSRDDHAALLHASERVCPHCHTATMRVVESLPRLAPGRMPRADTS
jgi:hypothetical protein